ncbi:peptidase M20 [Cohnella thailandensis]|uniref:Peptidase M20 n=1 Tax=Cohnella thailandensis TaxID=557557 RepID=A0A841T1L1_9BACL|nr:peptidase M20 [Cohnella thailandensis]MBB6636278.1 peptidase M20 [Cohnella thailandensis]MBP1973753.1 acetylornithine deacetylase/succinyl-diaminopimelate desuccinylase-like protein [Cohnella thailandensis]
MTQGTPDGFEALKLGAGAFKPKDLTLGEVVALIRANVDRQELIDLILELCNIRSLPGFEKDAGDFVYAWMEKEGMAPKRVGMVPDRFNVIGRMGGADPANGRNLLFTSHLDTEAPQYNWRDSWKYRPGGAVCDPGWIRAELKDGVFLGHPVENDRGPMACFLIGAKALRKAGLTLNGHLYLTACPAEIGPEHVEEFQGPIYHGKEIGAQYMMTHGGVAPDFAVAAEGTDFGISWVACGYANYRIDIYGEDVFTPLLTHPPRLKDHPSALVLVAPLIEAVQRWAADYEKRHVYRGAGGTAVPKAQIIAIRGGDPHIMGGGSEVCSLYLEVGLTPAQAIADVQRELEAVLAEERFEGKVEPLVYRQGFAAEEGKVRPLADAIDAAGRSSGKGALELGHSVYSSMWRDHNVFNMFGIPAATYGPRRFKPTVDDMADAAVIYAAAAWLVCNGIREGIE